MEIRVLKYFLMVAREENITKAANLLHLTQPTLSRQLMQLARRFSVSPEQTPRHSHGRRHALAAPGSGDRCPG